MYKNKKNDRWEATSPMDLIGWTIVTGAIEQSDTELGIFIVQVQSKDGRQSRTVYATIEAIPLSSVEQRYK